MSHEHSGAIRRFIRLLCAFSCLFYREGGSADNGDKDGDTEEALADPFRRAFNWYDGRMGENPQDAVERRETREEMLAEMTDKQREVFIMYFRDGLTQDEIAAELGIAKMSVNERLRYALSKAKRIL